MKRPAVLPDAVRTVAVTNPVTVALALIVSSIGLYDVLRCYSLLTSQIAEPTANLTAIENRSAILDSALNGPKTTSALSMSVAQNTDIAA